MRMDCEHREHRARRLPGGRAALHLILAVFLLRALLPVGYMPSFGAGAGLIEICTPQGIATLVVGAEGQPAGGHSEAADHPCPFGIVSGAHALTPEAARPAASHVFAPHVFVASPPVHRAAASPPRHRPRAPPAVA